MRKQATTARFLCLDSNFCHTHFLFLKGCSTCRDGKVIRISSDVFKRVSLILTFPITSAFGFNSITSSFFLVLFRLLPGPGGRVQLRCSVLGSPCVRGFQVPHISPPRPCKGSAATGPLGHLTAAQ